MRANHKISYRAPWYRAVRWWIACEWIFWIAAAICFFQIGLFFFGPFVIRLWSEVQR